MSMSDIYVLAEHRMGEIRDITFEMLGKGWELAENTGGKLVAVLLGYGVEDYAETLSSYADKVLYFENEGLKNFNAEVYQRVLSQLIRERKPRLIMMGHTGFGMDLAPALATELNIPLATDCIDLFFEDGKLVAVRQIYGGKVNAEVVLKESETYMMTVRSASFKAGEPRAEKGEIEKISVSSELTETPHKVFVEYIEPPKGEVDITAADIIVAVGRGIRDEKNIPLIEELAKVIGGVLACSRPIVDKGWLPKDRQVGSSGKTVRPKVYIAIGISGAFQHIVGMKDSELIIAINKDPRAPIFQFSDYGIVDDLFKVVPELTKIIKEIKGGG